MWQTGTSTSLWNIYLFCVDSGSTCPDKPLWAFNKSSHWRRKTFKTDWLTADSFMTKLLLLRSENSSLAKSMIVYSRVSVSPLIWLKSFTRLQHYETHVLLIGRSYDSSCHVTPVAFLWCVITSMSQSLLFMPSEEDTCINNETGLPWVHVKPKFEITLRISSNILVPGEGAPPKLRVMSLIMLF